MALWDELAAALPTGVFPAALSGQLGPVSTNPGPASTNPLLGGAGTNPATAPVSTTPPAPVSTSPRVAAPPAATPATQNPAAASGTSNPTYDPASAKFGWGEAPPAGETSPLTEIPAGYGAPLGGLGIGLLANYLTGKYLAPKAYSAGKSIGQSSVGKLLADLERHLGVSQAGKPQPMGSSPLTALLHLVGLGRSSPSSTAPSTAPSAQQSQMAQAYANIAKQLQTSMADYMSGLSPAIQERFAPYMKNDELMALAILAGMQANPTAGLPTSLVPATTTTGTAASPTPTG